MVPSIVIFLLSFVVINFDVSVLFVVFIGGVGVVVAVAVAVVIFVVLLSRDVCSFVEKDSRLFCVLDSNSCSDSYFKYPNGSLFDRNSAISVIGIWQIK